MKRFTRFLALSMALCMLLGCSPAPAPQETETLPVMAETAPVETVPPATVPADGNPGDVTCKGSYTGAGSENTVVVQAPGGSLTNGQLQAWYWAAVASYRAMGAEIAPDFEKPLDTQPCQIDPSVNSWQQYFLKQALANFEKAQALYRLAQDTPTPLDENYQRHSWFDKNISDSLPATKLLYGYHTDFAPNSMHQAFLDNIPAFLEELAVKLGYADGAALAAEGFGTDLKALEDMVWLYNYGYIYHTNLSYYMETGEEAVSDWFYQNQESYAEQGITQDAGNYVTFRQILLIPRESEDYPELSVSVDENGLVSCDEALWDLCLDRAYGIIVNEWENSGRPWSEGMFSELANMYSADTGTRDDGGAYRRIRQGQMLEEIDRWCFEEGRQPGDYTVLRTAYGIHILYFSEATPIWYAESQEDLTAHKQKQAILDAAQAYPMEVSYSDIQLREGKAGAGFDELLYPDLAHERFPEVPLYLQQDYGGTLYGAYLLRNNGCGLVSFAMVASYFTDEEWLPPKMSNRCARYSTEKGSDITLLMYEPATLGFYATMVYGTDEGYEALKNGQIVISIQSKGYWTKGGHYIVIEKLFEDDTIQVRDSNMFNYGKLEAHQADRHGWDSVTRSSKRMFIFDEKLTHVEACSRCGDRQGVTAQLLSSDYLCHKCRPALLRRDAYLSVTE